MACIRIGKTIICNGMTHDPATCRELVWSMGSSCYKCPAIACAWRGKKRAEVNKLHLAMWKAKAGSKK